MTYVPCRGCIEKGREPPCYVPSPMQSCCDCYLFTPQDREREFDRLRTSLDRAQRTQRDRYAEAALTGLLSRPSIMASIEQHAPDEAKVSIVLLAFEFANEAMEQRLSRPFSSRGFRVGEQATGAGGHGSRSGPIEQVDPTGLRIGGLWFGWHEVQKGSSRS